MEQDEISRRHHSSLVISSLRVAQPNTNEGVYSVRDVEIAHSIASFTIGDKVRRIAKPETI